MMDLSWIGEVVPVGGWRSISPPPSHCICTCVRISHPDTTLFDDAYAFLRYAKHWIAGQGFSWNSSDGPAFGCTRPLYQFVVTFFRWTSSRADGELLVLLSWWAGILMILMLTAACHIALRLDSMLRVVGAAILTIPLTIFTKLS